ncbi:hypothetical protein [Pseudoxanthomonas jiangsuensis]|uniref:hypothetical protein n=1 Tax=Pseudoxanthomonas jiangsuensis TaxID=619688 RepID=UPI001B860356|nr:hypothetical protein [Pseudoxanthomonas jiangsuensis]
MADNALPPLPPGFVLEDEAPPPPSQALTAQADIPPLPPGFELFEDDGPGLEIDIIGGTRESQATPEQRSGSLARDLGMSARSVIQGAGGLLGAVGGDAFNHYLVPGDQPSYRDAAAGLADRLGLPKPETGRERVMGDIGEALTGTGLTMGLGGVLNAGRGALTAPSVRTAAADLLTAQPKLQAVSTATGAGAAGVARESGAGEGTQLAAGLIGGLAPGVGSAGTAAALRGAVRGRSGEQMRRTINDFARVGATPSVGQASGNWFAQGAENLLAGGPTSAGVMNRFAERQADDIGAGLRQVADGLSPRASGEQAGRAIERGAQSLRNNTNAVKRALYWQADRLIPETTPAPLSNTWQTVVRLTTPDPGAAATTGALVQPSIARLRQNLEQDLAAGGGALTYSALKRVRSEIGEAISNSSPLNPTSDIRELRQLYGALSRDMEAVAQAQGPEAVAAARRANNYTRAAADRLEQVERVIDKNGGPERVFQAAMAGTRDGGTTLRAVMQSLPKDGQRAVTAAVIKRMGMPTPGQAGAEAAEEFSASTFLTNWNRVSPEARRALFDRHGPGFTKQMDRIARVAENLREGSRVYANPSGTANRAAAMTYGASLVGSLFTGGTAALVAAGAGANALARWMTNPTVVKRLADATVLPKGAIPGVIQSMRVAAERDGDQGLSEVAAVLEQLEQEEAGAAQQK